MLERYPPHGFHFRVTFQLFPQSPHDMGFQEVSGLSWTIETENTMKAERIDFRINCRFATSMKTSC